jgi:G3E family GTPase
MDKTKLIVVGGFLGAGKTTAILSMAKYLLSIHKKIGIVTNDQGSMLVDTNYLAMEGLPVLEVTGGCFCCNFDEFSKKVSELAESQMPDIILAEPVGSCTDLIATIFKPLEAKKTGDFSLAPLSILVDPKRISRLMMEGAGELFPTEVNYLFRKQLEEANVIVLNKTDLLNKDETDAIVSFLKAEFKGIDVLCVSAKSGEGMEQWLGLISGTEARLDHTLDIDYETYADAEAGLGWLNSFSVVSSENGIDMNVLAADILEGIRAQLVKDHFEIAHLKIYAIAETDWMKVSLTSILDEPDFNRKASVKASKASLIVNARINISPERLRPLVEDTLVSCCKKIGASLSEQRTECFSPSKPKPKYRMQ